MNLYDLFENKTFHPPSIDVGDTVLVGKFKNRKAKVTGFKKDDNNQPVLKTNKGDTKLFKPRIPKLMEGKVYIVGINTKVFENPSMTQIKELIKGKDLYLRGFVLNAKDAYFWDGYKNTHDEVLGQLYPEMYQPGTGRYPSELSTFQISQKEGFEYCDIGDYDPKRNRFVQNVCSSLLVDLSPKLMEAAMGQNIDESVSHHLPRKFWLNPKTEQLDACSDHASDVLSMGLPGTVEWEEHLSQYADDDEEYEDAIDQNQSGLLRLAMNNGWVRGGIDSIPFLHHFDKQTVRAAAKILRDIYGEQRIYIETDDFQGDLEAHDLDRFIKSGRFPVSDLKEMTNASASKFSPAFKAWFGNSKVVDAHGQPKVVYHGTRAMIHPDFAFDPKRKGVSTFIGIPVEVLRHGFFFTEDKEFANLFATQARARNGTVLEIYLSIKNPLHMLPTGVAKEDIEKLVAQGVDRKWLENYAGDPVNTYEAFDEADGEWFAECIHNAGFDGVCMHEQDPETKKTHTVWIAFRPNQIKAVNNKGSFNPDDERIFEGITDGGDFRAFWKMTYDVADDMKREYKSGVASQPWKLVPANRLIAIWKQASKDGFVRDEKGLQYIADIMVKNVQRLYLNTAIAAHTELSTEEVLDQYEIDVDDPERFLEWAIEYPDGWRISDYGLNPLIDYAAKLLAAKDDKEKMTIIDLMLQVTHQRSDLASWFVEGGTSTLNRLFEE